MKRKTLALLLTAVMLLGLVPMTAFAEEIKTPETVQTEAILLSDLPEGENGTILRRAVDNGLLKGADGKVSPNVPLTRGQMAAIITRAFGATAQGDLSKFTDVAGNGLYHELAAAYQMGIINGSGNKMNPRQNITRQEAFVIIARALKLAPAATMERSFADGANVAAWAKSEINAMVNAGYVNGDGMNLNLKKSITRLQFAIVFDNVIQTYIKTPGTVTTVAAGNVMINVPGVTLKNCTVQGDLIVGDGVADGDFTLDHVTVTGRTIVRGGGVNSFHVIGGSLAGTVVIAKTADGGVRMVTSGGANVQVIEIKDGKDDIFMEGSFGSVEVSSDTPVTLRGADVKTVTATGKGADITVDKNSKVATVATKGENTKITVAGTVSNVAATKEATGLNLNVAKGGTATSVTTAATGSTVTNEGKVGTIAMAKGADTKYVAGVGTKLPAITAEDKKDLSTSTVAAEAAKAAATKAEADKLAAEKQAAAAKTDAEKAAAKAAANQAAADKAAADKAVETTKKEADKVQADADKTVSEKPVAPPVIKDDGAVTVPDPIVPDKPKPDQGGGGDSGDKDGGRTPPPVIDPYTYVKDEAELKAAIASVSMVKLSANIALTDKVVIEKAVTIDGQGHSVAAPKEMPGGGNARAFNVINKDGSQVTFKNLKIVGHVESTGNPMGVSIFETKNATVNFIGCTVSAGHYPISVGTDNTGLTVNISGSSTISGWCAIQSKSEGTTFNITDSTLKGLNNKLPKSVSNAFSTVVACAKNNVFNLKKSTVTAEATTGNAQQLVDLRDAGSSFTADASCTMTRATNTESAFAYKVYNGSTIKIGNVDYSPSITQTVLEQQFKLSYDGANLNLTCSATGSYRYDYTEINANGDALVWINPGFPVKETTIAATKSAKHAAFVAYIFGTSDDNLATFELGVVKRLPVPAAVTIAGPTAGLQALDVIAGDTLTATLTGDGTANATYQWQIDGNNKENATSATINGETFYGYPQTYRVIVTLPDKKTVTSNELTVGSDKIYIKADSTAENSMGTRAEPYKTIAEAFADTNTAEKEIALFGDYTVGGTETIPSAKALINRGKITIPDGAELVITDGGDLITEAADVILTGTGKVTGKMTATSLAQLDALMKAGFKNISAKCHIDADAVIPEGTTVSFDGVNDWGIGANGIRAGATLTNNGTIVIPSVGDASGTQINGTLINNGTITSNAKISLSADGGPGTITNNSGATFTNNAVLGTSMDATITNSGIFNNGESGDLQIMNATNFRNATGGVFNNNGIFYSNTGDRRIINEGTFNVLAGTMTSLNPGSDTMLNKGTINYTAGTISEFTFCFTDAESVATAGTFVNETDAEVTINVKVGSKNQKPQSVAAGATYPAP